MRTWLKALGLIILVLIFMTVAALGWYRFASLPQVDGGLRLEGLQAAVDVVRDKEGIPHIYAQSPKDAYFALGFVHAQDRLWQMELNRRIPAGRMAEILGPKALAADRFLRTLGVRRNAERILAHLGPDARAALEAYAAGVNAFLSTRSGPLPPEFILTGAPPPEPWQPADSIAWQTMMAWDLGANWTQEILRMRLAQRLPLDLINQFLPPYPGDAILPTMDYTRLYRELDATAEQLATLAGTAPASWVDGKGSNNWVVGGARTTTGKPLLANDPHLGLAAPSLWYFAHLSAPGLNVIGATLPGLPIVVLGRNNRIAWGFTNTAPDVQDLYIERLHEQDRNQYLTPDGWANFAVRTETIRIKGQPDELIEVRESRHGPVITGALPVLGRTKLDTNRYAVSFAWTALMPDDVTFQAGLRFNYAQNWSEFVDAARDFVAPQQNIVYADVDGNIGFIAPGRIPLRKEDNDLMGLAPAPGWDARYDWAGYVPFEQLPRSFNPANQQFLSANEKIVDADYPHFLTSEWSLPYRAQRIRELLAAENLHTLSTFAAMQKDHLSLAAVELLPLLRASVARGEREAKALRLMQEWDGAMDPDRPEPLIYNAWVRFASYRMFVDELGEDLLRDYWLQKNVHQPMVNSLKGDGGQERWCGDARAAVSASRQACEALLSDALVVALDDLERRYGGEMADWRWGDAHLAWSAHRPMSQVPLLAKLFDIRVPSPGDTFTINVGRHDLRNEEQPYANYHAASLRALYDLSDLDKSLFIHSTGQSGNVLSAHYRNYVQRWVEVTYLPMRTRRDDVEQGSIGTLTLSPS